MKKTLSWLPKYVVSIVGDNKTGKSRLLREFAQNLEWDDVNKVVYGKKCANWRIKGENDIRVSGNYKGVKVAIMTGGDDADTIIRAFLYAEKWKCDILIIATHPQRSRNGISISWVSLEAVTSAYDIEWICIEKNANTDTDRMCVTTKLRQHLTKVMASLQKVGKDKTEMEKNNEQA